MAPLLSHWLLAAARPMAGALRAFALPGLPKPHLCNSAHRHRIHRCPAASAGTPWIVLRQCTFSTINRAMFSYSLHSLSLSISFANTYIRNGRRSCCTCTCPCSVTSHFTQSVSHSIRRLLTMVPECARLDVRLFHVNCCQGPY